MILEACPNCGIKHVQAQQVAGEFTGGTTQPPETWRVLQCQNSQCHRLILARTSPGTQTVLGLYPTGSYDFNPTVTIPQEIRNDYSEAGRCLDAGCYKASMVMSRRVLQRCLKDQGCIQRNLVDAIDHAIQNNILRKAFHSLAEEIRQYGNLGAHPDDDQLVNVNKESAAHVLAFTQLLVHEFFEVPATAAGLKKNRVSPPTP